MSATMSGDTPLGQSILPKSRLWPQNLSRDTSAQLLGSALSPITKNTKNSKNPIKQRGVGPSEPSRAVRKPVIPGTPETPQTPQGVTTQ